MLSKEVYKHALYCLHGYNCVTRSLATDSYCTTQSLMSNNNQQNNNNQQSLECWGIG